MTRDANGHTHDSGGIVVVLGYSPGHIFSIFVVFRVLSVDVWGFLWLFAVFPFPVSQVTQPKRMRSCIYSAAMLSNGSNLLGCIPSLTSATKFRPAMSLVELSPDISGLLAFLSFFHIQSCALAMVFVVGVFLLFVAYEYNPSAFP